MTHEHQHDWEPIPEICGGYACACGQTGYRTPKGDIVAHKTPRVVTAQPTACMRARSEWVRARIRKDYDGDGGGE